MRWDMVQLLSLGFADILKSSADFYPYSGLITTQRCLPLLLELSRKGFVDYK